MGDRRDSLMKAMERGIDSGGNPYIPNVHILMNVTCTWLPLDDPIVERGADGCGDMLRASEEDRESKLV